MWKLWLVRPVNILLACLGLFVILDPFIGCLNGGAQVKPRTGQSAKEMTAELQKMYSSLPVATPEQSEIVKELYDKWLGGQDSDKVNAILHTQYHAIEKATNALNIKW